MKNLLIIGGSVFTGRVFSIQASKSGLFNLHIVNRGNFPMEFARLTQYVCDRRSPRMIARLLPADITYDALIDFCAYNPGEIMSVIDALGHRVKQYIFFSSAGVYAQSDDFRAEDAPLLDIPEENNEPAAVYRRKKISLENELTNDCAKTGIKYTILRPTFIYGPYNYARRESYFIELIARKRAVPIPTDAAAQFILVYVMDVAQALMRCIGSSKAYDCTFNLAGEEAITYRQLISDFRRYNKSPFETREITIGQAEKENIPLPFPMSANALISGKKFSQVFDFKYTPFSEGMEKTFKAFYSLFTT